MISSNFADVGQIRSRRGTSTKRMTNAEALFVLVSYEVPVVLRLMGDVQSKGAEHDDHRVEGEDVGDSHRKTNDHGQNTQPTQKSQLAAFLMCRLRRFVCS